MLCLRTIVGALVLLAVPLAGEAQAPTNLARIGYLATGPLDAAETIVLVDAFRQGLREHDYVEGRNIVIDYRSAGGKLERFAALARELARLKLDLIVAPNTPAARAVRQATTAIPIVTPVMGDPIGDGLVASLARPGGNITGLTFIGPELVAKRLELLRLTVPRASRVAALWHPGAYAERTTTAMLQEAQSAAHRLGLQLQPVEARSADDLEGAFSKATTERAQAVFVLPSAMFFIERKRIVELAARHRLPVMYQAKEFVELGGLVAYGASIPDLFRRCAAHVDKILRGARPADLPVERPTKFELVVNLKAARALGLTIPQSVLIQADQVFE